MFLKKMKTSFINWTVHHIWKVNAEYDEMREMNENLHGELDVSMSVRLRVEH